MVKAAILGIGTVGGGTAEVLAKNRELIARRAGQEIELKYILCRSPRPGHPLESLIVHDIEPIASDPEVGVVAECMGGLSPAFEYVSRCLSAGKNVVTSNKELVAERGLELTALARKMGVNFMFEASVGGGIPILRPISQCLAANEISAVYGILNGTTNYILTEMIQRGKSFEQALREAQEKGFAEADPTADVEGIDAGRKICILADLCFGKNVPPSAITTEGITHITPADIACARTLGYKIKLLGRAMRTGPNSVTAFVAPHLISQSNPIANVDGVLNGIAVRGDAVGEAMFFGPGAGALPTASAVVGDIVEEARNLDRNLGVMWSSEKLALEDRRDVERRFFVRMKGSREELQDRVASVFGMVQFVQPEGVSGEFGFVTEKMPEGSYEEKAEQFGGQILGMIRVEE